MKKRRGIRVAFGVTLLVGMVFALLCFPARDGSTDGPNLVGALRRQNLDLPYDAGAFSGEENDEAPQAHRFYGQSYEADAIAFALDKSGSMTNRSRWTIQTREVAKALNEMSGRAEFGIVYYGSSVQHFKSRPVKGTVGNKSAGLAYVESQNPQGDTCIAEGVVEALKIVSRSKSRYRAVIVTSDGRPDVCATGNLATGGQIDTLLRMTRAANPGGKITVHTIYVGDDTDRQAVNFLKRLAQAHGGSFRTAGR